MNKYVILIFLFLSGDAMAQKHQAFHGNYSPTWAETIEAYENITKKHDFVDILELGLSDSGKPIHVLRISKGEEKPWLLVNNAIHPGEPCGVDASIIIAQEIAESYDWTSGILDKVNIAIIPMYNVGGALNRWCCSRANQNGPEAYGFRGNSRNLDLNRDFIKADSRNALLFTKLFHELNPHVFIDTHTTNGADYQYVMTMITTQPDKAGKVLGKFIRDEIEPKLYEMMEVDQFPMTPYVNSVGKTPDTGIKDYLETPRYSTGYAALFHCIGFTSEAHMFKPYEDRVEATYFFIRNVLKYMSSNTEKLIAIKEKAERETRSSSDLAIHWELDTSKWDEFQFKGYEAVTEKSELTGEERLRYDRDRPYQKSIKWYHYFKDKSRVELPFAYVVPFAWKELIERLDANHIKSWEVRKDIEANAETYYIEEFTSIRNPYEGHFLHRKIKLNKVAIGAKLYEKDRVIPVDQPGIRYIVESLEPGAPDSFFAWNFFDSILQQKEWFSAYIFEEEAKELLATDPELKQEFERRKEDPDFASDHFAQLYFIYQNSPNYESTYNLYPVLKLSEQEYNRLEGSQEGR